MPTSRRACRSSVTSSTPDPEDRLVGTTVCEAVFPGEPVAKQRPRTGKGGTYTPKKTRDAEEAIRWQLRERRVQPDADYLLGVHVRFYSGDGRRRDLDNLLKLLLDACNEFVWADDFQVTEIHAAVIRRADNPRTELVVVREERY